MGIDVQTTLRIEAPTDRVADYAMDPANDTAWVTGIAEARVLTDGPVGMGTRVARVAHFLGREIRYVNEIVGWQPGARVDMKSVEGPFPMEVTYRFDTAAHATDATIWVRGDASGFFRLATPLIARQLRRAITADLQALKARMEA